MSCFNCSLRWKKCVIECNCCLIQVMDYNIGLGKQLLPLVVQVLKYCTCPQLRHYFQQPPRCSLWALRPHIRQMWLKALLVILYKVSFHPMSDGIYVFVTDKTLCQSRLCRVVLMQKEKKMVDCYIVI